MKQVVPTKWPLIGLLVSALGSTFPVQGHADVITDWNELAMRAGQVAGAAPDSHSRSLAMTHIAMFEAVNSIEPRYTPYRSRFVAMPASSREAAAAAAAHDVLVRLFPAQQATFDASLLDSLAALPAGASRDNGVLVGQQAAAALLNERDKDGSEAPNRYVPFTVPGRYVPTAPVASSTWGAVKPFALKTGDQFRPPPPYALTSAQWAADYNEIKAVGRRVGSTRTVEQTEVARFWQLVGPATYNPVARQVAAAKKLDVIDNARLFALFSMATADAAIAVFDAKYTYNFWRPVTAIRCGDMDGNDATEMDAGWEPYATMPMHPEYPCAHCIFQGSAAGVLRALYGDTVPAFALTSATAPGVTRSFTSLSAYVTDVINGRVWEGVHYRTSGDVGAAMGRQIAEYTVQTYFRPL